MTMRSIVAVIAVIVGLGMIPAHSQSAGQPWVPLSESARFETGDTWTIGTARYRLYGVQACLRGTSFTNTNGQKRDCGEAGLAVLLSLVRDLKPQCANVLEGQQAGTIHVTCFAFPTAGKAAGSRIDLGTALIASGFAFAALKPDGKPVHLPYFVAELDAKRAKAGLWAFPDLPEPNAIIFRALRDRQAGTAVGGHGANP